MSALLELQQAVGRAIVSGDTPDAARLIIGDGLNPQDRLGIYRNTFIASLTAALRLSFPAIERLVGAEFFEGAAQIFIQDCPPTCAYLNEYGAAFPDFLARFAPAAQIHYLPDVARLEWAVNRALHAPNAVPLDLAQLNAFSDTPPQDIRFIAHPAVSLLRSDFPVDAIWRATLADDDAALEGLNLSDGPAWLLVGRGNDSVAVSRMDDTAWRFAAALCAGETLAAAFDAAGDSDAAALLAPHLAAGRFIAIQHSP